jgi:hypothetical protein
MQVNTCMSSSASAYAPRDGALLFWKASPPLIRSNVRPKPPALTSIPAFVRRCGLRYACGYAARTARQNDNVRPVSTGRHGISEHWKARSAH